MNDDRYLRRVYRPRHRRPQTPFSAAAEAAHVGAMQPRWMEEACRLQQKLWQHANYVICRNL